MKALFVKNTVGYNNQRKAEIVTKIPIVVFCFSLTDTNNSVSKNI